MNKITIIGAGKVGSTIAYTLSVMNLAKDIVMIDINHELALGEALDIRQGTPFSSNCSVYAGDYPDAANSNIVVITSGVARKPGQSRLELAQTNVNIMKSIMPQVTKYAPDAMYIIVSNPVDILTYQWCKRSGLPENHIIGSGTILDTARLKARLSEYYNISQSNVHAYVFGEHGDSSFVPWSLANISNIPVTDFRNKVEGDMSMAPELNTADVEQYIRRVRVPHLQVPAGRHGHDPDRFHHDARRIRHRGRVPERAEHRGLGGRALQAAGSPHRGRDRPAPAQRVRAEGRYQQSGHLIFQAARRFFPWNTASNMTLWAR